MLEAALGKKKKKKGRSPKKTVPGIMDDELVAFHLFNLDERLIIPVLK